MTFDNMNISNSLVALDILYFINETLNDHLATQKSINTPVRRYIKSLIRTNDVLSTELVIISHEYNAVKDVVQARKQHKTGK